jgi:hypothetical protein
VIWGVLAAAMLAAGADAKVMAVGKAIFGCCRSHFLPGREKKLDSGRPGLADLLISDIR